MRLLEAWLLVGALGFIPACASSDKGDSDKDDVAADSDDAKDDAVKDAPQAKEEAPPPVPAHNEPPPPPAPTADTTPPPAAAAMAAPAAAPAAAPGFDGPKVTRYVRTIAIKIHKEPSKDSEVVGWVHRGAKIDVIINGDWAKLESGHFVSNKFLVENPPATPAAKGAPKSAQ